MWQYAYCNLYFGQTKKSIDYRWEYWTFTINCFLEHEWYLCPIPHCCCIHVYCDVCSWWLYNMLENYKLHHPCNDNTRTMQKLQAGTTNFFCVCTCFLIVVGRCKLTQFPQKWNNKSDWYWQRWFCDWVTQLMKLQSFQGMLVTGVRFIFNLKHCSQVLSHTSLP